MMIKRFYKYVKFIFCVVLIFSMTAPSYAALSASDGSIFVTKGEFDAVMVDFNSRLTTFEAGINSKIDSQVTSYIERNGIWNPQDIDLTDTDADENGYYWCYKWLDIFNKNGYAFTRDENITLNDNVGGTVGTGIWYIGKPNKTGLFFCDLSWFGHGGLQDKWSLNQTKQRWSAITDEMQMGIGKTTTSNVIFWGVDHVGENVTYDIVDNKKSAYSFGKIEGRQRMGVAYGTRQMSFSYFVTKGDDIYFSRTLYAYTLPSSTAGQAAAVLLSDASWGDPKNNENEEYRPHFKLNRCKVY